MSDKRRDFLVEIGTEELPPKSLPELSRAFTEGIATLLAEAGLKHGAIVPYAAPRRLAVYVPRLAERQPDQKIERRGPPVSAAFDATGRPTRAATAFADSCGTDIASLGRVTEPKGEFLHYRGVRPGAETASLLPGIIQASLDRLPIAKRMRWGAGEAEFVRPVHWVVMLFGREVVPCTILGVPAGRQTRGHRFHAPKPITVTSPSAYPRLLETRGKVLADFAARRARIREGVTALGMSLGGEALVADALLDEVTALVEWPVPVAGRFDERFLGLPPEVVIATVQDHQRYFPVRDAAGRLTQWFITVSNIESADPAQVRAGNERVVRPRLADAAFFWDTDRARPLAARSDLLGTVTFQTQLGTVLAKALRVADLAERIAPIAAAEPGLARRAAELAKCDLMTAMVGEFPELQGLMGRYYAAQDGEPGEVAAAIEEQYRPRFAGDSLPSTAVGTALALADKLDTIVGIFAAGQKPSGTRDPFGLRRAALGVLRILIERRLDLDLIAFVEQSLAAVRTDMHAVAVERATRAGGAAAVGSLSVLREGRDPVAVEVYDYVMERLRAYYLEDGSGITTEMFDAVLARRPASPLDFDARLKALAGFLTLPDAASLAAANKRIANILRKAGDALAPRVDPALLQHAAELELARALEALREDVESLLAERRYEAALRRLATLRPQVDAFFDGVMVMAEEPALRANRLALLAALQRLFLETADLSRLPG